jgi:hypothetical protein
VNRFAPLLRKIDKMLDIPQPAKSRVILEIAADMQKSYEHFIGQGIGDGEALRCTVEEFDLSAEEIASLAAIHDSPLKRYLYRFSSRTRTILEGTALALIMIPVAIVGYELALSGGLSDDSGIWKWPLLAGTIAAAALGLSKWYTLFVVKDHRIRAVRKWNDTALYIAVGQLAIGLVGMYIDLFQTWAMSAADKTRTVLYLAHWLQRSSALLSLAMIAALVSGLIWIVNSGKAASIEKYEAELLIDSEGESL